MLFVVTLGPWSAAELARTLRGRQPVAGIAFLIAIIGVASGILGNLYLLFRDERPVDEPKKLRKRLLVSNWKSPRAQLCGTRPRTNIAFHRLPNGFARAERGF